MSRAWRLLVCALLVFGLFPGSDELVETVVHLVHDGHLPHAEGHDVAAASEDCGGSDEHGCTPLSHHCGCCVSLAALVPGLVWVDVRGERTPGEAVLSHGERGPPRHGAKPFLPPPIV